MTDPSISLTPDDNPQEHIELGEPYRTPGQPYGMAAWSIGLLVLLVLRGVLSGIQSYLLFFGAMIVINAVYLLFAAYRPKLPLRVFVMLTAELGLLYSLPVELLYNRAWHDANSASNLIAGMVLAALAGLMIGRGLDVEKQPTAVIGISFLVMFIFVNLVFAVLAR